MSHRLYLVHNENAQRDGVLTSTQEEMLLKL